MSRKFWPTMCRVGLPIYVGVCANFFAVGRCFEASAETSETKQFNYGDWTLNCEKLGNNRLSECSLVQNVKDPSASDGLAWIQTCVDTE